MEHYNIRPNRQINCLPISLKCSSPKSKEFVNGILDKYTKDILEKKL